MREHTFNFHLLNCGRDFVSVQVVKCPERNNKNYFINYIERRNVKTDEFRYIVIRPPNMLYFPVSVYVPIMYNINSEKVIFISTMFHIFGSITFSVATNYACYVWT